MDYADLTNLSLVCLVAGLTLFVTSRRLAQRARLYQAGMQSLLQLFISYRHVAGNCLLALSPRSTCLKITEKTLVEKRKCRNKHSYNTSLRQSPNTYLKG
jgi:hypothetical protein